MDLHTSSTSWTRPPLWSLEGTAEELPFEKLLTFLQLSETRRSVEEALLKRLHEGRPADALLEKNFEGSFENREDLRQEIRENIDTLKRMCAERSSLAFPGVPEEPFEALMASYQEGLQVCDRLSDHLAEQLDHPKDASLAEGAELSEALTQSLEKVSRSIQKIRQDTLSQFVFRQQKVSVAVVMLAVAEDFYHVAEKVTQVLSKMQTYYSQLLSMFDGLTYLVNKFQKMYTDMLSVIAKYSKNSSTKTSFSWDGKESLTDFPKKKITYKSEGKTKMYYEMAKVLKLSTTQKERETHTDPEETLTTLPGYALLYCFNLDEGKIKPSDTWEENIVDPSAYDFYPQGGTSFDDLTSQNWMVALGTSEQVPQILKTLATEDPSSGIELHTSLLRNASEEPKWYISPEGFNRLLKSVSKGLEGMSQRHATSSEAEGELYKTWQGSASDSLNLNAFNQAMSSTMNTINGKSTNVTYQVNQVQESITVNRRQFEETLSNLTAMRRAMVS